MIGYLQVGDINTENYNAMFSDSFLYAVGEPNFDTYSVNGANGDLHISNGRFDNISYSIKGVIHKGFEDNYLTLRTLLLNMEGYQRISHSCRDDYFRKGKVFSISPINSNHDKDIVTFSIVTSLRPELYLVSGEDVVAFTGNGSITNPCSTKAKPLIRVYGKGTLKCGDTVIEVNKKGTSYIDIDIDTENAYEGSANRNDYISVSEWGGLVEGTNTIEFDSTITKVEITPRWYLL